MSERPTPETDIEHLQFKMGGFTLDFCRKLERERDEARELAAQWEAIALPISILQKMERWNFVGRNIEKTFDTSIEKI